MTPLNSSHETSQLDRIRQLGIGLVAGLLAGVSMLACMAFLRLFFYVPTPAELIFDRVFPFLTVKFFIGSLVRAGGYTPLKLQGVYGAIAGQLAVASLGGVAYAWFVGRGRPAPDRVSAVRRAINPRGWLLIGPGVVAVWLVMCALLWPQMLTNYHGRPPAQAYVISASGMLISFAVCGVTLMLFYGLLTAAPAAPEPGAESGLTRRRFVAVGAGALAAAALGGMLRRLYQLGSFNYDGTQYGGPQVIDITPTDKFYQVTKNLVDPDAARDLWRIDIVGHVETPRAWSFAELTALPAVEQETTLQCISYGVGSGLISNAIWKGVPLPTLLAEAKPKAGAVTVLFHAADGFFETIPYSKAIEPTTILAWEMNGAPLPARHGFPVRLIVPGIYGERSAKWVTRLEFLAADDPRLKIKRHDIEGVGFYTEQGWGPNIYVPTTSRIDAPQVAGDHFDAPFQLGRQVELRGMAFGGDKGISKVELSFDDGRNWTEAPITTPGTPISWSIWRYQWTPAQAGECVMVVRATNAHGEPQIATFRDQVPHGATGLHRVRGRVDPA